MAHNRELSQFANAVGYNGGNIGIGTDNPDSNAQATIYKTGGNTPLYLKTDNANSYLYFQDSGTSTFKCAVGSSSNTLKFVTDGSERLRITSAGLLGVATGSPSYRVDIGDGTSDPPNGYQLRINAQGDYVFALQKASAGSFSIRNNSTGVVHLNTQNSKRLALGVSSANTSGSIEEDVTITSAGRMGLGYNAPDTMGTGRLVIGNGSGSETLTIFSSSTTNGNIHFADGTNSQDRYRGYITYHHNDGTNANYMAFGTNDVERLRITSDGKIGIGEDSPDGLLVIKGDSNGASNPSIRLKDGTDTREAWITNASGDLILANGGDDNTPHCKITMFDANIFSLETANTERLRVHATGEVTKSTQPRFWARLSTSTTYNPSGFGNYIDFDLEEYDIGGNFQTSGSDQGLFIAPVAGMYQFSASAYCVGQALTQSWFVVNNSRKNGTDWVLSTTANFTQNFQMIYLNVGDKVGFHPHKGGTSSFSIVNNVHHTYFKGCLLG